jgi:hypothetical protein
MPDSKNAMEAILYKQMADSRITVSMTPRELMTFVFRLASDDDFRARLERDPHGVLAENHVHIPTPAVPLHINLPPKGELQEALAEMMRGSDVKVAAIPFNVDPGYWIFIDFLIFLLANQPCSTKLTPAEIPRQPVAAKSRSAKRK